MTSTLGKLILRAAGALFFALGFVGMLLPLLPTTVFWILAAICFAKSAPRLYGHILAWPGIGPAISAYLDHGVIDRRGKRFALSGMGVGAIVIVASPLGAYTLFLSLIGIAGAAAYVLTRPSAATNLSWDRPHGVHDPT